jgi:quercetin dioxygenase-like cupin family protein
MMSYRIDFNELSWESPMKGLRFKAFHHQGRRLRLVEYTKEMEPHWCENGHIGYILEGRFEIRFDDEVQTYSAGDGVFILPGKVHRHKARTLTNVVKAVFVEDL